MSIRKINPSTLQKWVNELIQQQTVYGVQKKEDKFAFDTLKNAADLRLDYDVTILPPKKYFQPQREVLLNFNRKTVEFESVIDETPFVVFGVHPYDMVAISQMDKIFSMDNYDKHYMARRANATIVVVDVQTPSSNVFAGCMGNATMEGHQGHDVLITRLDDVSMIVESKSDKGDELVLGLANSQNPSPADLNARQAVWDANRQGLQKQKLKVKPEDLPALLDKSRAHPVWEEKADLCYSCGSCNFVCPTCFCFDVSDEMNWDMETGQRVRTWDGCMLAEFAAVAGGHNFRSKKAARYSHRYYRKGKYSWDMYGEIACVGCGRCSTACTANIANPVDIFNTLAEAPE